MNGTNQGTVLVADLRGLVEVVEPLHESERDAFLGELYSRFTDIFVAYSSRIEQTRADRIALHWGEGPWCEEYAARAVRAAMGLRDVVLGTRNRYLQAGVAEIEAFSLAVGIATGLVVRKPRSGKSTGTAVTAAVQLCECARNGWVLVDSETEEAARRLCKPDFDLNPVTPPIDGIEGSLFRCQPRHVPLRKVVG